MDIFIYWAWGKFFCGGLFFFFKLSLRHVSIAFLAALTSHYCLSQRCFCLCWLVHLWAHTQFMSQQSSKTTLSCLNLSLATKQCVCYGRLNSEHPVRRFWRIYFSWLKKGALCPLLPSRFESKPRIKQHQSEPHLAWTSKYFQQCNDQGDILKVSQVSFLILYPEGPILASFCMDMLVP